jgi:hypothetical protein
MTRSESGKRGSKAPLIIVLGVIMALAAIVVISMGSGGSRVAEDGTISKQFAAGDA